MFTSQPCDSPLPLAVSAVAMRVFSIWRHEDFILVEPHSAPYTDAIKSLRLALERRETRCRPDTALAILALHLYESISAVYDAWQATPVHHHGALSLLPIATSDSLEDLISMHVKGFVLHTEISSALRQKRSMHLDAQVYLGSPSISPIVPGNLSSILDTIGAQVVELQASCVRGLSRRHSYSASSEQQYRAWIAEAGRIEELLRAWAEDVPDHWRPLRLTRGQDFSSSITAYLSACDIYPSCQIATIWNLWRFHSLLVLKISAVAMNRISILQLDKSSDYGLLLDKTPENATRTSCVQSLVDSICYSVPFYLGNRNKQSNLNDFTDPNILLPSYHLLAPGDARIAPGRQRHKDAVLSADEHHRHFVAYGAWHIVSPLSNLLTLVSDGYGGQLVANCLRPGQHEWICKQFLRASTVVRLPAAGPFHDKRGSDPSCLPVDPKSTDRAAESLARQVRKGTRFMSGP